MTTTSTEDNGLTYSFAEAWTKLRFLEAESLAPEEQYADGEELFVEEHTDDESAETTEREEWEEKPALAPELEIWLGSVRDANEILFGGKTTMQEVVGAKNSTENQYDNREETPDEACLSESEKRELGESRNWEDESTPGERDTIKLEEEEHAGPCALQYAYAMLVWSFELLPPDIQAEFQRQYIRLKTYLKNRARSIDCTLTKGKFPRPKSPRYEYDQGFRKQPLDSHAAEMLGGAVKSKRKSKPKKQESFLEWVKKFK